MTPAAMVLHRAADEFAHIRRLARGDAPRPAGLTLSEAIDARAAVAEAMCRAVEDEPIITNAMSWAVLLMGVAALNEGSP